MRDANARESFRRAGGPVRRSDRLSCRSLLTRLLPPLSIRYVPAPVLRSLRQERPRQFLPPPAWLKNQVSRWLPCFLAWPTGAFHIPDRTMHRGCEPPRRTKDNDVRFQAALVNRKW